MSGLDLSDAIEATCDVYNCKTCGEAVPRQNSLVHSLSCNRRARTERGPGERKERDGRGRLQRHRDEERKARGTEEESDGDTGEDVQANTSVDESQGSEADSENARIECQFCLVEYPARNIVEHAERCGSRTDVCQLCLGIVRLRDMQNHHHSGCTFGVTGRARIDEQEPRPHRTQERRRHEHADEHERPPLLAEAGRMVREARASARRMRSRLSEVPVETAIGVAVSAVAAAAALGLLRR